MWAAFPWLVAAAFAAGAPERVWQDDVFLHVRMGLDLLQHGRLGGDPGWTFGPADPGYATTLPGSQAAMGALFAAFGGAGGWGWGAIGAAMVAARAAIVAGAWLGFALVAPRSSRRSPGPARAASALLLVALGIAWVDDLALMQRPQVVSLALMPVVAAWLLRAGVAGRFPRPWWVLALVAPWAWLHGYALLVAPLLACAWVAFVAGSGRSWRAAARRSWRAGAGAVAGALLGTLCTPLGPAVYAAGWRIQQVSAGFLSEWGAPVMSAPATLGVLALAGAWAVLALAASRGYWGARASAVRLAREGLLVAGVLAFGLSAQRTVVAGALILVVLVAARAMRVWGQARPAGWERLLGPRGLRAVQAGVVAMLAVVAAAWMWGHPGSEGLDAGKVPVALLGEVAAGTPPEQRLLIVDWGVSSAAAMLVPQARVAVDGRADRYGPDGAYRVQVVLLDARAGWPQVLARYDEARVVVARESRPFVGLLRRDGWVVRGRWRPAGGGEPLVWLAPGPGAPSLAVVAARGW